MNVIEAEHLYKTFRVRQKEKGMKGSLKAVFHPQTEEIHAVNNVSFSAQEGEMLAFIGPNGAGKSTTIKMLTGILYPDLSLGQRIRCEIVASLIHRPKVLFLDEPTIGLDPVVKENIRSLIKQMNREMHTTIFLTSHDIGDIEKLCKRIIIVNSGRIVLDDSMEHLKYHYLNKKILEIKLREETALPQVKGITILKQKGSHIKLEVDTAVIEMKEALRNIDIEHVEDINISNVPLENIIMEIYRAENVTAGGNASK